MIKLFYSPPWKAFVAPRLCDLPYHNRAEIYGKAYAEAKANALPIGNAEIIKVSEGGVVRMGTMLYIEKEEGEEYQWPGTYSVKNNKIYLDI